MGVIQKQSISGTIYSYIGVALGFVTTALLFPKFLSASEIGLLRLLVSYSILLAQFATLGMNAVTIRLFPYFRDLSKKHHGYLGIVLLVSLLGFILTTFIYLLARDYIIEDAKEKSALFIPYFYYVIPIFFFTILFNVFDTYYRVLYNAVKGVLYKEIIQRILIIFVLILFCYKIISFHQLVILYSIAIILPSVFIIIELYFTKQLFLKIDFSFLNKNLIREIASVAFFGIIIGYSGVLIMNIDLVMINHYLGLSNTGIYSITFFFGTLIIIPSRSMNKISSVVISDSWKSNDTDNILDIYKKSSLLLTIIAMFIFILLWANIDNVFKILGKEYALGKYVIFFIGLANVVEALSGGSSLIISTSRSYKMLSLFLFIYTLLIIITNIIFIPILGISGAALASFISRSLYIFLKYLFLKIKYKLQPFSMKHIFIILISIIVWGLSLLLKEFDDYIVDIVLRSLFISIIFIPFVYFTKISNDFNNFVNSFLSLINIRNNKENT